MSDAHDRPTLRLTVPGRNVGDEATEIVVAMTDPWTDDETVAFHWSIIFGDDTELEGEITIADEEAGLVDAMNRVIEEQLRNHPDHDRTDDAGMRRLDAICTYGARSYWSGSFIEQRAKKVTR